MTKKQEILLKKALDKVYAIGFGLEPDDELEKYFAKKLMIVGTTVDEKFNSLKGVRTLIKRQKEQTKGLKVAFKRKEVYRGYQAGENVAVVVEEIAVTIKIKNETIRFDVRSSAVMEFENGQWKLVHWHASKPEMVASEADTFGIDVWKEKAEVLEKQVEERTADLVVKNRELAIEASLERVRTVAMGLNEPADMLEVCKTITLQLQTLGVKDIRNVQTAIFYPGKGTYMNYEYYARHHKTFITETYYTDHKVAKAFAAKMQKGKDQGYITSLKGEKVQEWLSYQKKTNVFIDKYLEKASSLNYYWHSLGPVALGISTYTPLTKDELKLFNRFINVFELAYTRYLDIEQAIAQAKEARVEASLERVRSVAMGMHKPEDILNISQVFFQELVALGFTNIRCALIHIFNDEKGYFNDYDYSDFTGGKITQLSYRGNAGMEAFLEQIRQSDDAFVEVVMKGDELKKWKAFRKKSNQVNDGRINKAKQLNYYFYSIGAGNIGLSTFGSIAAEQIEILKRFRNVFDFAYRRYLDVAQAEAQAREAQIELALERVRSRTMAMHKSGEVMEVAGTLFQELQKLGFAFGASSIIIMDKKSGDAEYWIAGFSKEKFPESYRIKYFQHPYHDALLKAWKTGKESLIFLLAGKEKKVYDEVLFNQTDYKNIPQKEQKLMRGLESVTFTLAFMKHGAIHWGPSPLNEEERNVLHRFAKVFEQSYTRFLDLQKAEAQAREARIEAALERVRSASMAMHSSDELQNVIRVLTDQLTVLGFEFHSANFITNASMPDWEIWISSPGSNIPPKLFVPYFDHRLFNERNDAVASGKDILTVVLSREEKSNFLNYFFEHSVAKNTDEERIKWVLDQPGMALTTIVTKSFSLSVINYHGKLYTPSENELIKRLAQVFEQSYTRFLDLKKAEAQAKEAQIETALERVRSRTMGMQKSEELKEVIQVVFQQFIYLNINIGHTGFVMDYKTRDDYNIWIADPHGAPSQVTIPYFDSIYYNRFNEAKAKGLDFFATNLNFEEKNKFYQTLFKYVPGLPEEAKDFYFNCPGLAASTVLLENISLYIENFSGIPYTDEENNTLMRLGKVFQQTYTRFLDLQKAESQAREAKIEAALEKVRSRTMAMQKSEELAEITFVLFQQLKELGEVGGQISIGIYNEEERVMKLYATIYGNQWKGSANVQFDKHEVHRKIYAAWKEQKKSFVVDLSGEALEDYNMFKIAETPTQYKSKDALPKDRWVIHTAYFSKGLLFFSNHQPHPPETIQLLERFAGVFDLTYTRFLDLQNAEAQAREAQIQLALERVRARTMAMQKSDELREAVLVIYEQLQQLGFDSNACNIIIIDEVSGAMQYWVSGFTQEIFPEGYHVPFIRHPYHENLLEASRQKKNYAVMEYSGKMKKSFDEIFFTQTDFRSIPEQAKKFMKGLESVKLSTAFFSFGALQILGPMELTGEKAVILQRFAKVFEQTYTRFLDLQKAEAQAKEAQIEGALERVRSRSLAMHSSGELGEVVTVVLNNLLELGYIIDQGAAAHLAIFSEGTKDFFQWSADPSLPHPVRSFIPYTDLPILAEFWETRQKGHDFFARVYSFEEKNTWFNYAFEHSDLKNIPAELKKLLLESETYAHSVAIEKNSAIIINSITGHQLSENQIDILRRFSKVFEQAYVRFLDLQKAEAQSREAQIELGLERVRARAMAMQRSDELKELIGTVSTELAKLDLVLDRCFIMIYDLPTMGMTWWMSNPEMPLEPLGLFVKYHNHPPFMAYLRGWEEQQLKWEYTLEGSDKENWDAFLFTETELSQLPAVVINNMKGLERVSLFASFNKFGCLSIASQEPLSTDQTDILLRFAKVFELTYTRFNDLQKAEAQAREAQIELGLERVRARAMAMQKSDELNELVGTVYTELTKLDFALVRCLIWVMDTATNSSRLWMANSETPSLPASFYVPYHENPPYLAFLNAWKEKNPKWQYDLHGNIKKDWDEYVFNQTEMQHLPAPVKKGMQASERVLLSASFHNFGCLQTASTEPLKEEHFDILNRFAKVFDLTYTRFNDLQKAEAQGKEAQIEAALERVRSRTLAMQKSDELAETAAELFRQLIGLGIEPNRLYIGIVQGESGDMEMWATDEDGTHIGNKFLFNKNDNASVKKLYDGWKAQQKSLIVDMQGKELEEYFHYLSNVLHIPFKGGLSQERRVQSVAYFSKGFIGMASPDGQGGQTIQLLERFAAVFNLTFTRFNDLKIAEAHAEQAEQDLVAIKEAKQKAEVALTELQATQKQLIQSEKMASLGELTAGIAHEIQNPLNFVNNFSEVSNELIDEMMEEVAKGNYDEVKSIAEDVKQNLEKINHHGKRADGIVKGMLQHSRASSATKEPTDISKLADEYLRLAYHGLRAKDKTFNATLKTDYDESIGLISIFPQDIGRVILNLITNAFYVVAEKKKTVGKGYEPIVSVTTRRVAGYVEISIKDNGSGIPPHALDKIFQPFFTTKPTGQGTGLGLSLSYDIVKAHGGELRVDTTVGSGTTFIIVLPANS